MPHTKLHFRLVWGQRFMAYRTPYQDKELQHFVEKAIFAHPPFDDLKRAFVDHLKFAAIPGVIFN